MYNRKISFLAGDRKTPTTTTTTTATIFVCCFSPLSRASFFSFGLMERIFKLLEATKVFQIDFFPIYRNKKKEFEFFSGPCFRFTRHSNGRRQYCRIYRCGENDQPILINIFSLKSRKAKHTQKTTH